MAVQKPDMIDELANYYQNYLKVDMFNKMTSARIIIEEMITRMEEFDSILRMIEAEEFTEEYYKKLLAAQAELSRTYKAIDKLMFITETINCNLTAFELALDRAEASMKTSDSFFTLLNPLSFFKKSQEPVSANSISNYEIPRVYDSDEFFMNSSYT
ncbi:biogenesis of lysosome-related organelles complex 1 subunit 4 [Prorops nasuta]|uniref:biogenesis of lysosome-related organelles complex 1 subunit 4 n=1 Tax=Prorops nasuta TaxID=863751 RepID=UPI0034CFBDF8